MKKQMKNLLNFKSYSAEYEYKTEYRREIELDRVRKSREYRRLLALGFDEDTSHQQEINNTMKFVRNVKKQKELGHGDVFYTIHPSGTVRRYNPIKSKEVKEGNGNDIKKFSTPFKSAKDYAKGLNFLWQYLKRKEARGDYR
jgi:hypothetical protein